MANSIASVRDATKPYLLSPVDLQAVKAAGVTFVVSLLERVIEEQARGSAEKADAIRADIAALIGHDLSKLKPGSAEAAGIKAKLIARGVWSQYLEVGIGPDAEVFTKCQPMASVGYGADVGLHPISTWNNPEPEIAVLAASHGRIVGATLGNDVNLRDVEGRSALLLGKAKDNNASAALGPFIRLFDESFSLDDVKSAVVGLKVEGEDGFVLEGASSMAEISRSPEELVAAAMGPHHQYPDGIALYLGTMFAPAKDRGEAGKGFTHRIGDIVTISSEKFGALVNRVQVFARLPALDLWHEPSDARSGESGSYLTSRRDYLRHLPAAGFRQPYAAEHQRHGDCVVGKEGLAEHDDRQQRPEDRHEVDEEPGAVGADQFDASDVEYLRQDRREDDRIGDDGPALRVGQRCPRLPGIRRPRKAAT